MTGIEPLHEGWSFAEAEISEELEPHSLPMQTYKLDQSLKILEAPDFGTSISGLEVKC